MERTEAGLKKAIGLIRALKAEAIGYLRRHFEYPIPKPVEEASVEERVGIQRAADEGHLQEHRREHRLAGVVQLGQHGVGQAAAQRAQVGYHCFRLALLPCRKNTTPFGSGRRSSSTDRRAPGTSTKRS